MKAVQRAKALWATRQKQCIAMLLALGLLAAVLAACIRYLLYAMPVRYDVSHLVLDTGTVVRYGVEEEILDEGNLSLGFSHMGRGKYVYVKQEGFGEEYLVLEGWAFVPEENISVPASSFLLRAENGTYYKLRTTALLDDARTEEFGGGEFNYNLSGMCAVARRGFLPNGTYSLCIAYENDGNAFLVDTGIEVAI